MYHSKSSLLHFLFFLNENFDRFGPPPPKKKGIHGDYLKNNTTQQQTRCLFVSGERNKGSPASALGVAPLKHSEVVNVNWFMLVLPQWFCKPCTHVNTNTNTNTFHPHPRPTSRPGPNFRAAYRQTILLSHCLLSRKEQGTSHKPNLFLPG